MIVRGFENPVIVGDGHDERGKSVTSAFNGEEVHAVPARISRAVIFDDVLADLGAGFFLDVAVVRREHDVFEVVEVDVFVFRIGGNAASHRKELGGRIAGERQHIGTRHIGVCFFDAFQKEFGGHIVGAGQFEGFETLQG